MKTNKWFSTYNLNSDGATQFYFYISGAPTPTSDLAAAGPPQSYDGGVGIELFFESRGYAVTNVYNQLIRGRGSNPSQGFTYDQYKAEIDAGRPVMIHVEGHTMVGVGYDDTSSDLMYIHDTWDYDTHTMTWGDSYTGMPHHMVTVVQLEPPSIPAPTLTSITPSSGLNTGIVHITNLAGSNFRAGASVKLARAGQPDLSATNVSVVNSSRITCDFDLTGAATGLWDVVVTNPDAQSYTLANSFTMRAPGVQGYSICLPLVLRRWPPIPDIPVVNAINNSDGDGNYTVSWSTSSGATNYVLEEATNPSFTGAAPAYSGAGTSTPISGKEPGTYFYRVKAINSWGSGGWSHAQSVTVGPSGPTGVINGDFEDGPTGWTEYSKHGWDLIVTKFPKGVTPHSGSWAVWLGGDYNDISFVQQQVTVPPGSPYLAYWHWVASADVCGFDFGGVIVNGSEVVDQYNLCQSENTGGWVRHTVNLNAYAGQSISLQIRVETDESRNSNLFVDDVSFQASASPTENGSDLFDPGDAVPKPSVGVTQGLETRGPATPQFFFR
jgi:hypothetical protein